MQPDFVKALARILVYEGDKVDDPQDPGGRTNKGVTQSTFNSYLRSKGQPTRDVYTISPAEVAAIYKTRYWDVILGDQLPPGLDLCVFDGAVNSGCGQSGKWLQYALGAHYEGAVDGILGAKTIQAIEDFGNLETLINAYCSRRLATLQHLRTWKRYGNGWHARIANVMKISDAWAAGEPASAPHPVDVSAAGGHQKASVADLKPLPLSQISTHVITASAATSTVASQAVDQLNPVADTFSWMKYVLGGLTIVSVGGGFAVKAASGVRDLAQAGNATATVNLDADAGHPQVEITDDVSVPTVS